MSGDQSIYLDHHATTPVLPAVIAAMQPHWCESFGNASSSHSYGRRARRALDDARELIAAKLDAHPDEVLFTSGATESNNLAVFGLAGDLPGHILVSAIEHPCVIEPVQRLGEREFAIEHLPVGADGVTSLADLHHQLRPDTRFVALMRVNHETGAVQPIVAIDDRPWHCDAAQAVGKLPVKFHEMRAATLAFSGHKIGAPQGVGALLVRRGVKLKPIFFGGHQQQGRRPGTEPVALAVGLAKALELALHDLNSAAAHVRSLRTKLIQLLNERCKPVVIHGPADDELQSPFVLNISFPVLRADALLAALDLAGVACSTGSACSSGSLLPSPVLKAMAVPDDALTSAMRFSFADATSEMEIVAAAQRIADCVSRLRQ